MLSCPFPVLASMYWKFTFGYFHLHGAYVCIIIIIKKKSRGRCLKSQLLGFRFAALVGVKLVSKQLAKPRLNAPGPIVMRSRDRLGEALTVPFHRPLHPENVDSCLALGLEEANLRSVRLEHPANSHHSQATGARGRTLAFIAS